MTIDDLAVATQQEFQEIRKEMAAKSELSSMKSEILHAIEGIDTHISAYASQWSDDFERLDNKIEDRLRVIEKKLR